MTASQTSLGHLPAQKRWAFDESVAMCFDDMLTRSIPLYAESVATSIEYLRPHLANYSPTLFDLGCGTGAKIVGIRKLFPSICYVGVDNSKEMIDVARIKHPGEEFIVGDLRTIPDTLDESAPAWWKGLPFSIGLKGKVDAITLMWTMQFIPIEKRQTLLRRCRRILAGTGAMIIAEKCRGQNAISQEAFDRTYRQFKLDHGYSAEEVDAKARALEGVLVPLSAPENKNLIASEGFHVEEIVGWGPFRVWYCVPR